MSHVYKYILNNLDSLRTLSLLTDSEVSLGLIVHLITYVWWLGTHWIRHCESICTKYFSQCIDGAKRRYCCLMGVDPFTSISCSTVGVTPKSISSFPITRWCFRKNSFTIIFWVALNEVSSRSNRLIFKFFADSVSVSWLIPSVLTLCNEHNGSNVAKCCPGSITSSALETLINSIFVCCCRTTFKDRATQHPLGKLSTGSRQPSWVPSILIDMSNKRHVRPGMVIQRRAVALVSAGVLMNDTCNWITTHLPCSGV